MHAKQKGAVLVMALLFFYFSFFHSNSGLFLRHLDQREQILYCCRTISLPLVEMTVGLSIFHFSFFTFHCLLK